MRPTAIAALLATLSLAAVAHADFVVTGSEPAPAVPPPPLEQGPAPVPAAKPPPGKATPKPPRRFLAYGFGHQVTLRFAAEQIIPKAITVTYGPGADPDALVDWKGGDSWDHVLRAAIQPLGLRLVLTSMAADISK